MKKKPNKKPKGLTDAEMIEKYSEAGKDFKGIVRAMVCTPSPTSAEKIDKGLML